MDLEEMKNDIQEDVQDRTNVPDLMSLLHVAGVPIEESQTKDFDPMIFVPTVLDSSGKYSVLDFCDSVATVNASLYQFAVREFATVMNTKNPQFYLRKAPPKVSTHGNMAKENLQKIYGQTHEEIVELPEGATWEMFCEAYAEIAPEFFSFSPNQTGVVHWVWSYSDLVDMLFKGEYELAVQEPEQEVAGSEAKLFDPKISTGTTAMEVFMICWKKEDFLAQRDRMV